MKKIFNVFAVLLLTGMIATGFVSCSNASDGGSGSGDGGTNKKILVVYASKTDMVNSGSSLIDIRNSNLYF